MTNPPRDFRNAIEACLPRLRRYARALLGSRAQGDAIALGALQDVVNTPDMSSDASIALFQAFHARWQVVGGGAPGHTDSGSINSPSPRAERYLMQLTPGSREVLLLGTVEGFSQTQIAQIIGQPIAKVQALATIAYTEMHELISGKVLIIEDEPLIAMDLSHIVQSIGHSVIGQARTADSAFDLAKKEPPDLILADIQLADASSGIDAVDRISKTLGPIQSIFVTAFPERLLTGNQLDPTFVITKPFSEAETRSMISQALFFAEDLPILQG